MYIFKFESNNTNRLNNFINVYTEIQQDNLYDIILYTEQCVRLFLINYS